MTTPTPSSTRDPSQPELVLDRQVTELLVPVGLIATRDRGVEVAARYAQSWDVPIRLIHVRPPTEDDPSEVADAARRVAAQWQISAEGVDVVDNDVASAVETATLDGTLLVLATDHVTELESPGSVGERIVRATDNPVLLCGPNCIDPPTQGSVVVALDGSSWAEAAVEPAVALAARTSSTLWVVHVATDLAVAHVDRLRRQGQRVSTSSYIRETARDLQARGVDVGWEVVQGDPVGGLVQFAADRSAAVIVSTTHGETGLARRVLGSVSMGMAQRSSSPVLIIPTSRAHTSEVP